MYLPSCLLGCVSFLMTGFLLHQQHSFIKGHKIPYTLIAHTGQEAQTDKMDCETKLESWICGIRAKIRQVLNWAWMYQQQNSSECRGAEHESDLWEKEAPHGQRAFAPELLCHKHLSQGMLWKCHIPDGHEPRQQNFSRRGGVLTDLMHGLLGAVAFSYETKGWHREEKAFGFISFCAQAMHLTSPHFFLHVVIEDEKAKCFPLSQKWELADLELKNPTMGVISLIEEHFSSLRMEETITESEFHDTMNRILKYKKNLTEFCVGACILIKNQEVANPLEAFTCEKNTENHSSLPFSIKGCNQWGTCQLPSWKI